LHKSGELLLRKRFRSPGAAAFAGIIFSVLFSASLTIVRLAVPADLSDAGDWVLSHSSNMRLALSLMPFAGIAFLWFMGVVRDHLGAMEDQFFSTVYFGSGLLLLAMVFTASAMAGGILTAYSTGVSGLVGSELYLFGRYTMLQLNIVYGLRMAGVFMISLGTVWLRTGAMPRWASIMTYLLAAILIITISLNLWVQLVFPGWVFVISAYVLIARRRFFREAEAGTG
jgi:hypothetical protein